MTVMRLSEAANPFSRLSKVYGLLSLQDVSTVFHPRWNTALWTPLPKCGTVHMGRVPVTVAIPNEVRGA